VPQLCNAVTLFRNVVVIATCSISLAACGGSDDDPVPATAPVAVAPTITGQPAAATVVEGESASFAVTATGTAPLTYQWQRNGTTVAGATAATYALVTGLGDDNASSAWSCPTAPAASPAVRPYCA